MTIIVGFDTARTTGWAVYDDTCNMSAIKCGCFEMPEKADAYYTADQTGLKTTALLRECKERFGRYPDFAVLEQQIEAQVSMAGRGQSFAGSIYPWLATASIVATLANFKVPYGTLMPATWRKSFFGQGFKPPLDNKGKKNWKKAAMDECERLGITLPSKKALADDAAEACALAICWKSKEMKLHAGRYHSPWMDLIQRRNGN